MKKLEVEEWCNPVGLQTVSQKRLYDHCVTQVFARKLLIRAEC